MRFPTEIFLLVLSCEQLMARSINKRDTSSASGSGDQSPNLYNTLFFDSFHELFGFYEVPPPKEPKPVEPLTRQFNPEEEAIAKKVADEAASKKALEEAAAANKAADDALKKAAEEALAKKVAGDAAAKKAAEDAATKKAAEEALAKKAADDAAVNKAADDALAKKAAEEMAVKKAAEDAVAKKAAEDDALKKAANDALAKKAAEEAAVKKAVDDALAKKADEDALVQKAVEDALARKAAEDALVKKAADDAAAKKTAEDAAKKAAEDLAKKAAEEAAVKKAAEEASVKKAAGEATAAKKAMEESVSKATAPIIAKPAQPTAPVVSEPAQPHTPSSKPVFGAPIPNKPHPAQPSAPWWSGQQGPYFAPPRPYGPQPWWRQPSPRPTIPQNFTNSHPSQPKYIPADQAIPNKVKDIKVGIPNKTPDLRPARPLPPFHMEPSPFSLPREECITAQGELGECASHFDCGQQGGRPRGLCHLGHDVSAHTRTCCVYPSFCGYQTNREVTYFKNPNFPNITTHLGDCLYRVNLLPGVCQIRVDFMDFLMKPMKNGDCEEENSLGVSSNDENAFIPVKTFCGLMATGEYDPLRTDNAHIYVNVDDDLPIDRPRTKRYSTKNVDFRVKIQNHPTRWNVRISQIQCDGANLFAPLGCSQYYNMNKGNITSLNYMDGAYANNLDMAICIKRDPAACAIHYRIHAMGVGPTKGGATGKTQLGYGLTCDDYLIFNGERTAMCGLVSKGPKDIILPVKGEQGLTFSTDSIHIPKADTGFHIEYQYIHNCNGVEFYKYPTPGRRNQ